MPSRLASVGAQGFEFLDMPPDMPNVPPVSDVRCWALLGVKPQKKPRFKGLCGLCSLLLLLHMVEAAGVEPASE